MTVRELLARADSLELAEWMAFFKLENEEARRAWLEARAEAGLDSMKAKRSRSQ